MIYITTLEPQCCGHLTRKCSLCCNTESHRKYIMNYFFRGRFFSSSLFFLSQLHEPLTIAVQEIQWGALVIAILSIEYTYFHKKEKQNYIGFNITTMAVTTVV